MTILESTPVMVLDENQRAPLKARMYGQITRALQIIVHQVNCQDFQELLKNFFGASAATRKCGTAHFNGRSYNRKGLTFPLDFRRTEDL